MHYLSLNKLLLVFILIVAIGCNQDRKPNLKMGFHTRLNDTFSIVKTVFLTNNPEVLNDGAFLTFWKKWGHKSFAFNDVKTNDYNTLVLDPLETGVYTVFMAIDIKGLVYTAEIDSVRVLEGNNHLNKQIELVPVKTYPN